MVTFTPTQRPSSGSLRAAEWTCVYWSTLFAERRRMFCRYFVVCVSKSPDCVGGITPAYQTVRLRLTARQTQRTTIAPSNDNNRPAGLKPRSSVPQMAQLTKPPTTEPAIPSNIVASRDIASLPGMIKRASAPAIKPMINHQMKLSISASSYDELLSNARRRAWPSVALVSSI